jgi:iron complex transport system permease protein
MSRAPGRRRGGSHRLLASARARGLGLLVAAIALGAVALLSLLVGTVSIDPQNVLRAFYEYDPTSRDHLIVREIRVDRMLVGIGAGAAFAVSGALMQALTRNPLADPGILGVSGGAAFAIVVSVSYLGIHEPEKFVWLGLIGAAVSAVIVYGLGSAGRGGGSPVKLALAGATYAALIAALTSGVVILDTDALDTLRFWLVGSLAGRERETVIALAPLLALGFLLAFGLSRALNALALGEDVARSLGQRVSVIRASSALAAVVLAAVAVAIAGPVVFIGLTIPHVARALVGPDERWIYPYAAVFGAILILASDVLGRVIVRPDELEVGVITAFVGAPFFIYLVRRRKLVEL